MDNREVPLDSYQPTTGTDADGHRFATVSAHDTSEGRIAYQRCTCDMWRIQRYPRSGRPAQLAVVARPPAALLSGRPIEAAAKIAVGGPVDR
ncbi:MAG: hypothetical protein ABJD68_16360 [Nakamurella sp.]